MSPKESFIMVFYLNITDLQYNSKKSKVPMGPKQPGPTVPYSSKKLPWGLLKLKIDHVIITPLKLPLLFFSVAKNV